MRLNKTDKHDYSQLIAVGDDMVGAVTVKEGNPNIISPAYSLRTLSQKKTNMLSRSINPA
jgi:hypothetical protein